MKKLIGLLIILCLISTVNAWCYEDFEYRTPVWISGIYNGNNVLARISLDTEYLTENGYMNWDCSDIRICDYDDESQLNYYAEDNCPHTSTFIYANIPQVSPDGQYVYVYYGNTEASSESTENQIFTSYLDFSDTIYTDDWEVTEEGGSPISTDYTISESGGWLTFTVDGNESRNNHVYLETKKPVLNSSQVNLYFQVQLSGTFGNPVSAGEDGHNYIVLDEADLVTFYGYADGQNENIYSDWSANHKIQSHNNYNSNSSVGAYSISKDIRLHYDVTDDNVDVYEDGLYKRTIDSSGDFNIILYQRNWLENGSSQIITKISQFYTDGTGWDINLTGYTYEQEGGTFWFNGSVTLLGGAGVPYANVSLTGNTCSGDYYFLTNASGHFERKVEGGEYTLTIKKSGLGTYHDSDYLIDEDTSDIFILYPFSLNITAYDLEDNSTVENVVVSLRNNLTGIYYSCSTNSSGGCYIVLPVGNYTYSFRKAGYYDSNGSLEYLTSRNLIKYMIPIEEHNVTVLFRVINTLNSSGIEGAFIDLKSFVNQNQCGSYNNFDTYALLETDASGEISVELPQGWYGANVYADKHYDNFVCPFRIVGNNTVKNFYLLPDVTQYPSYTLNGTTFVDDVASPLHFKLDCRYDMLGELIDYETDVVSNGSGFYEVSGLYYQSLCQVRVHSNPLDYNSSYYTYSLLEIDSNLVYNISVETKQPYYVYVGNYSTGRRILGSTVTVSVCNSTWGSCNIAYVDYDNNEDELLRYYLADNVYVSFKAEKEGYLTGYNNFTSNDSDTYYNHIREIGLNKIGGNCYIDVYFQSEKPLGDVLGNPLIDINYYLTKTNDSNDIGLSDTIKATDTNLFNGDVFAEFFFNCGDSKYIMGDAYALVETDAWGLDLTNDYVYVKVYDIEPKYLVANEYIKEYKVVLKTSVDLGDIISVGGDSAETQVNTPISQHSNIFSQILAMLLEAFGYDSEMSFIMLIFWVAMLTIFITLAGGTYKIFKWSTR